MVHATEHPTRRAGPAKLAEAVIPHQRPGRDDATPVRCRPDRQRRHPVVRGIRRHGRRRRAQRGRPRDVVRQSTDRVDTTAPCAVGAGVLPEVVARERHERASIIPRPAIPLTVAPIRRPRPRARLVGRRVAIAKRERRLAPRALRDHQRPEPSRRDRRAPASAIQLHEVREAAESQDLPERSGVDRIGLSLREVFVPVIVVVAERAGARLRQAVQLARAESAATRGIRRRHPEARRPALHVVPLRLEEAQRQRGAGRPGGAVLKKSLFAGVHERGVPVLVGQLDRACRTHLAPLVGHDRPVHRSVGANGAHLGTDPAVPVGVTGDRRADRRAVVEVEASQGLADAVVALVRIGPVATQRSGERAASSAGHGACARGADHLIAARTGPSRARRARGVRRVAVLRTRAEGRAADEVGDAHAVRVVKARDAHPTSADAVRLHAVAMLGSAVEAGGKPGDARRLSAAVGADARHAACRRCRPTVAGDARRGRTARVGRGSLRAHLIRRAEVRSHEVVARGRRAARVRLTDEAPRARARVAGAADHVRGARPAEPALAGSAKVTRRDVHPTGTIERARDAGIGDANGPGTQQPTAADIARGARTAELARGASLAEPRRVPTAKPGVAGAAAPTSASLAPERTSDAHVQRADAVRARTRIARATELPRDAPCVGSCVRGRTRVRFGFGVRSATCRSRPEEKQGRTREECIAHQSGVKSW